MPKRQKIKSQKQSVLKNWASAHPVSAAIIILLCIPGVLAIIAALIFGIYLLIDTSVESIERRTLATTVEKEAIAKRAEKERIFDNAHQHKIDVLKSAGVISLQDKSYSSKLDICGMAAIEGGWMATDWTQYCTLKYADLLSTSLSREEILSRLSSHSETTSLFGEAATGRFVKVCDKLYNLYGAQDRGSLNYYIWTVDTQDRGDECFLPTQKNGEFGWIITDSETRIVRSFKTNDVDRSKTYIGVFSDNEYYRSKRLGCYGYLFCESPFEAPKSGFGS